MKMIRRTLLVLNDLFIAENKKLSPIVKAFFSNKINTKEKIILNENYNIISNDKEITRILTNFFMNIVLH